jgi:hypothetical protein
MRNRNTGADLIFCSCHTGTGTVKRLLISTSKFDKNRFKTFAWILIRIYRLSLHPDPHGAKFRIRVTIAVEPDSQPWLCGAVQKKNGPYLSSRAWEGIPPCLQPLPLAPHCRTLGWIQTDAIPGEYTKFKKKIRLRKKGAIKRYLLNY